MTPIRVAHVITGLGAGGAEFLLLRLLERLPGGEFQNGVIALRGARPVGPMIERLGVGVEALEMGVPPSPRAIARLRGSLRRLRPDVVQTWLLHANVIGGLAARAAGARTPVCWGVHVAGVDPAVYGRTTATLHAFERRLAPVIPTTIVACSQSAAATMLAEGFPNRKIETVLNGFDTTSHRPDAPDRRQMREELGIADGEVVVGHVGRYHPMKDQANLLVAARIVIERRPDCRFLLCGPGLDGANAAIAKLRAPLGDRALLLGERTDIDRLMRAFDVFALSSAAGEALPLVVGEAMATAVPVVATDCGDAPALVGDTGRIVPTRDPAALAAAIVELAELPAEQRRALGTAARGRIETAYSLETMVDGYAAVWRKALASRRSS